ncbi:MAG: TatD family hydrolase, partial [Gemmatimonadota bacterium]
VFHCFTETEAVARAALDLDFYISFSGILTFRNAADLREVARFGGNLDGLVHPKVAEALRSKFTQR